MKSIKNHKSGYGQPDVFFPDHSISNTVSELDEVDKLEESDFAAPLPSERTDKQQKIGNGKGTSAKDKRRLREKRRSTGVATLTGHEPDAETLRNTTYNEVGESVCPAVPEAAGGLEHHPVAPHASAVYNGRDSSLSSSSIPETIHYLYQQHQQPSHNGSATQHLKSKHEDVVMIQNCAESIRFQDSNNKTSNSNHSADPALNLRYKPSSSSSSSSDFAARNFCARPFEVKRGILKTNRPVPSVKPDLSSRHFPEERKTSNEETRLVAKVAELGALLESEKRENALVKKLLSDRDSKIRELELQIATLNEDLDLADEDYLRLEEENCALGRALSEVTLTDEEVHCV